MTFTEKGKGMQITTHLPYAYKIRFKEISEKEGVSFYQLAQAWLMNDIDQWMKVHSNDF